MTPGSLFIIHAGADPVLTAVMPTESARSPWSLDLLHGGPVAALIAHTAERLIDDSDLRLTRLTTDLFRPIPYAPLALQTTVIRDGRRLKIVSLSLFAVGDQAADRVEVGRAQALLLRGSEVDSTAADILVDPLPFVETDRPARPSGDTAYHNTVVFRDLNDWGADAPGASWIHIPVPLLPDVPLSPAARAAATADFVSPMANSHGTGGETFINADITTYLHRPPQGDWIGLAISDRGSSQGIAVGAGILHDRQGPFGRAMAASISQDRRPIAVPGGKTPPK